jgi:hypothetical protein
LELARREGTSRPESEAIRAHNPADALSKRLHQHGELLGDSTAGLAPTAVSAQIAP